MTGGVFLAAGANIEGDLLAYEDYLDSKCNCDSNNNDRFNLLEFVVDMLMPLGFGTTTANSDEVEWLKMRGFINHEFQKRLELFEDSCQENINSEIESCQALTNEEIQLLREEFEAGIISSMALF